MASSTIRIVACKDSYEADALSNAVGYAKAIAEAHKLAVPDVVLLTHTKQLLRSGVLATQLGEQVAKALSNNKPVNLPFGGALRNETLKTMSQYVAGKIVIACYGEDKLLDFADGIASPAGIIVIPDLEGSADAWIERWNPTVHGEAPSPSTELIDDPVVRNALTTLSKLINMSTGLSHPRDKQLADEILRILRVNGHQIEPSNIKSWAIRNGWKPKDADQLATVAAKVDKLKSKPSLSKLHDPNGRYARWTNSN